MTGLPPCYANLGLLAFRLWASTDYAITQPIFITKDLCKLVIDGYVMPSNEEFKALNVDDKKSLKELIKKDNEVLSLIGSAVEESIFPRISVAESSKQEWDILKKTYEDVVVAKLKTLR